MQLVAFINAAIGHCICYSQMGVLFVRRVALAFFSNVTIRRDLFVLNEQSYLLGFFCDDWILAFCSFRRG